MVVDSGSSEMSSPRRFVDPDGGEAAVWCADSSELYGVWPSPTVIVSDGPYGLGMFPGDPRRVDALSEWYRPHVAAWSARALPETTLWFWCSERGWAEIHHLLERHGWEYAGAHIWDKGIGHVAGRCNSRSIRGFPVVTEICVRYVRRVELPTCEGGGRLVVKDWLRYEWKRSGLRFADANRACGCRNAATRKYLTRCHHWYFPPGDKVEAMARYAAEHGHPTDWPYFSLDGHSLPTAVEWDRLRAKWNYLHGVTNVWRVPTVRGSERKIAGERTRRSLHINQKPETLMETIILASSDPGDVVWEPFGGLFTASLAAASSGRRSYAAEILPRFFGVGVERLRDRLALIEEKTSLPSSAKANTAT